jgi:hypothetical protein
MSIERSKRNASSSRFGCSYAALCPSRLARLRGSPRNVVALERRQNGKFLFETCADCPLGTQ